jgi:hypothetical protein
MLCQQKSYSAGKKRKKKKKIKKIVGGAVAPPTTNMAPPLRMRTYCHLIIYLFSFFFLYVYTQGRKMREGFQTNNVRFMKRVPN